MLNQSAFDIFEFPDVATGEYFVPDVLLRDPQLLVPSKKPLGPVKIDWSHPLTENLIAFYLLRNPSDRCLVNPERHPVADVDTVGNPLYEAGNLNTAEGNAVLNPRLVPTFAGLDKLTSITSVDNRASSLITTSHYSVDAGFLSLINNAWAILGVVNDNFISIGSVTPLPPNFADQGYKSCIAVSLYNTLEDGSIFKLYANGNYLGEISATGYVDIPEDLRFSAGDTRHEYYMSFSEECSAEKIKSIYHDPYQFLIPA